jgi:murein L,D-transpeptidase YafK
MVAGSLLLKRSSPLWRAVMASAALAASVALSGCQTDGVDLARAMTPLSPRMLALFEEKGMNKESPILARIFKEESELEIWKQDNTGRYVLLKTYPICRWSGELGPKIKQGDRQAPEGFYTITPGQMNPNSSYYLSFNMGFPNAFDRAHGRTGAHLMVHGDCSSAGCYAMTNEQIAEIYALARESFFGGQQAFQVQAYPFRMTALNMAKHRNSPHFAFWKMLKQGYDHFEVSRLEPKVNVCDRRYVFDAESPNASRPLRFDPSARCPAYEVNPELREAVAEKQRDDDRKFADLVRRGTETVAARTGRDGGMHPTFLAKLSPRVVRGADGKERYEIDPVQAAKLGTYVNPPKDPDVPPAQPVVTGSTGNLTLASAEPNPAPRTAAAKPEEGTFSRLSRWVGLGGSEPAPPPARPAAKTAAPAAPAQAARPSTAAAIQPKAKPQPHQEASMPEPRAAFAPTGQPLMSGATPVLAGDSFENRFGQMR